MIITVDGYDGTGKSTLAKKLAQHYGFMYVEKPLIHMVREQKKCSFEEATEIASKMEKKLFATGSREDIAKFYCGVLLWLKQYEQTTNIILDRGFLTMYAVVGYPETEKIFDHFLEKGAFFTASIYLKATDEERVRRMFVRNPSDPDLKKPKWHENNLEEYAADRHLLCCKIGTDFKTPLQVFDEAVEFCDEIIFSPQNHEHSKLYDDDENNFEQ